MKRKAKASGPNIKAAAKAELFVAAYLANGQNATQAAIAAGYSARSAGQAGNRMLRNVQVAQSLAKQAQRAITKASLTAERVLHEVSCIVHADPRKLLDEDGKQLPLHKLDEVTARAIASVEFDDKGNLTKVRFWDKNTAAGHAMRYLGLVKPDMPIVPPSPPPAPTILNNGGTVLVGMDPMEAYRRMLKGAVIEGESKRLPARRAA